MGYISNKTIRQIKDNVQISDVFEWLGAKVVRKGARQIMAFCPFCADAKSRNPGCSLNDEENLFHCLAGHVKVITDKGAKPIAQLAQSGYPVNIVNGNGEWEEVLFSSYGKQRLLQVSFISNNANNSTIEIEATDEHQWILKNGVRKYTKELVPGDVLMPVSYSPAIWTEIRDTRILGINDMENLQAYEYIVANILQMEGNAEEVYCCRTSTHSFVLAGGILTSNCFVCGASGDIITAVQKHEDCNFPEAIEMVAKQFNIPIEYEQPLDPERETRRRKMTSALEDLNELFKEQREDKHFNDFLAARSLSYDTAMDFELGLSLYTEAEATVQKLLDKGHEAQTLIDAGICYENDSGELVLRFKNRIMFPIRTAPGTLIGFGGRDITGKSKAKYINSPETELFHKSNVLFGLNRAKKALTDAHCVYVCEGYMDTMALQSHGFLNSVGVMGVALTERNFNYLAHFADILYISLDGDEAGQNAAMRIAKEVPVGFRTQVCVITIPSDVAKDPDEFFNQKNMTEFDWNKLTDAAVPLFLFCIKRIIAEEAQIIASVSDNNVSDNRIIQAKTAAKKKAATFMAEHLAKISADDQKTIADYLARELHLIESYSQLAQSWRAVSKKNAKNKAKENIGQLSSFKNSATQDEDLLIGALYYHPEIRDEIKKNLETVEQVFTSELRTSIFDKICESLSHGRTASSATDGFNEQETSEFARILLDEKVQSNKESLGEGTVITVCNTIKRQSIEHEIAHIEGSPNPDIMRIIALKSQLAQLMR